MDRTVIEKCKEILSKFALSGEIVEIEPCGTGHINDTFHLKIQRNDKQEMYTLQRMNGDVFKNCDQLMENIQRVTEFLRKKICEQGGNPDCALHI